MVNKIYLTGYLIALALCFNVKLVNAQPNYLVNKAEGGDAAAQFELGVFFLQQKNDLNSKEIARKWFLSAAKKGDASAQYNLGIMSMLGDGVPVDLRDAEKWFLLAAKNGHVGAQFNIGSLYQKEVSLSKGSKEAEVWLRMAADSGHVLAQNNMAVIYDNRSDLKEAAKWYLLAAEGGYPLAQYNIGVMYAYGDGVPLDYELSYFWLSLAYKNGIYQALEALKLVDKRINYVQRTAVKKQINAWKPRQESINVQK